MDKAAAAIIEEYIYDLHFYNLFLLLFVCIKVGVSYFKLVSELCTVMLLIQYIE